MTSVPIVRFSIVLMIQIMRALAAALALVWSLHFRGGLLLNSDNNDLIFNMPKVAWSCLATIAGSPGFDGYKVVLLNGGAMLVYTIIFGTKNLKKLIHLSLQCVAFCLGTIRLWAALKFHNDKGIDNFYSLHPLLVIAGFTTYWYPGGSKNSRSTLMPWYVFFGVYIYGLTVASAATGILEKATFLQTNNVISRYSIEALLVNSLGVLMVAPGGFVILVIVAATNGRGNPYRGPKK